MRGFLLICALALIPFQAFAASHYINSAASGAGNGSSWTDAWTGFGSVSWTRGDTYYVGTGSYGGVTLDASESGSLVITVKKATVADHGTATGWSDTFAFQAQMVVPLDFQTAFWVFDGNGTSNKPSNSESDYGFKVSNNSLSANCIIFRANDITLRGIHLANQYTGADNSSSSGAIYFPSIQRIKLQNCWLENSGSDGFQMNSATYLLVERCYLQKLGTRHAFVPDNHGQTVQMFSGASHVVFRWNVWDRCEGQALIAYANVGVTTTDLRFYGNVVFNGYGTTDSGGFNAGIVSNSDDATDIENLFIYNNTIVNNRDSYCVYSTLSEFKINAGTATVANCNILNNLFYNSNSSLATRYTTNGYHASGGLGTAGGTNEQTNITGAIFANYTGNDYRLAAATDPGDVLTGEPWWNASADPFFGTLDSAADMNGVTRGGDGAWDRGAFEFQAPAVVTGRPDLGRRGLSPGTQLGAPGISFCNPPIAP